MSFDMKNIDVEFLLDKSGSMGMYRDTPSGRTRWEQGQETTAALAAYAEQYDADGITVVPFNDTFQIHEGVTAAKVAEIFGEHKPIGSTDTATALAARLEAHFARRAAGSTKSTCLIVYTDGAPDDPTAVAKAIIAATQRMEVDEELAISFVQVGQDAGATAFLKKLDDDLQGMGAKFDIVDTKHVTEVKSIEQVIEAAFND